MFLRLTCLFAAAPSMPGVPRKATDSADMMRAITDDRFALKLMQKLMQPLSMVVTNLFLICSCTCPPPALRRGSPELVNSLNPTDSHDLSDSSAGPDHIWAALDLNVLPTVPMCSKGSAGSYRGNL